MSFSSAALFWKRGKCLPPASDAHLSKSPSLSFSSSMIPLRHTLQHASRPFKIVSQYFRALAADRASSKSSRRSGFCREEVNPVCWNARERLLVRGNVPARKDSESAGIHRTFGGCESRSDGNVWRRECGSCGFCTVTFFLLYMAIGLFRLFRRRVSGTKHQEWHRAYSGKSKCSTGFG